MQPTVRNLPVFRVMTLSILMLLGSVRAASPVRLARDVFRGSWKVVIVPDDDSKHAGGRQFNDTLIFRTDDFVAESFKARGYAAVHYETDTRAFSQIAQFSATAKSETDGTAKWAGAIDGSDISGTLVWTQKDGTVYTYSFKGTRP